MKKRKYNFHIDYKKLLHRLGILLGKTLRKLVAIVIFVVFAAIETSDWLSLMAAFGSSGGSPRVAGLNAEFTNIYLVVLTLLALAILLFACQTIVGILRGAAWAVRTAQATAVCYMIYGSFQIYSAITNPGIQALRVIPAGGVFIVIGLALFGLGTQLARPN
jgi:hypothetical protein